MFSLSLTKEMGLGVVTVTVEDTEIRKVDTSEIVTVEEIVTMVADMMIAIADMMITTIAVIDTQAVTTTIIMTGIPELVADHLVLTTIATLGMIVCVL